MLWMKEVQGATSVDDLKTSRSISGQFYPNFDTVDARIATGLKKIFSNSNFKRGVHLEGQKALKEYRFLRGRRIVLRDL